MASAVDSADGITYNKLYDFASKSSPNMSFLIDFVILILLNSARYVEAATTKSKVLVNALRFIVVCLKNVLLSAATRVFIKIVLQCSIHFTLSKMVKVCKLEWVLTNSM